jgi:serine/threonine-protein kinase/endoribonuclease IRE1
MAPSLRISSLIARLSTLYFAAAELVAVRSTPGVRDVSQWKHTPAGYRFLPPAGSSTRHDNDQADPESLDIVLLASIDGTFYALNRNSGQELWSTSTSLPHTLPPPSALAPLVRTKVLESTSEWGSQSDHYDEDSLPQETYIIEPQTGDIYVTSSPSSPLQRLPFSMPQLVEMSPFQLPDNDITRTFTGRRDTSLLVLELETGHLQKVINSECPWDAKQELKKIRKSYSTAEEVDLDDLESDDPPERTSTLVYIGRTDYQVSIKTENVSGNEEIPDQTLVFSTYGPSNDDATVQTRYRRTSDDLYVQPLSNGEVISFKAPKESESGTPRESKVMWHRNFKDTVVAVFDVVSMSSRSKPFLLLQPKPRLEELFPHVDFHNAAKQNSLPNIDSTYVGMVKDTGSLFAMSPETFPLLLFGGNEERVDPRYLLDAPEDATSDIDKGIDQLTRQRQLRQLCQDGSLDRRCFTGMRRMDEDSRSRYSRLIGGSPYVEDQPQDSIIHMPVDEPAPSRNASLPSSPIRESLPVADTIVISTAALKLSIVYPLATVLILLLTWFGWKRLQATQSITTKSHPSNLGNSTSNGDLKTPYLEQDSSLGSVGVSAEQTTLLLGPGGSSGGETDAKLSMPSDSSTKKVSPEETNDLEDSDKEDDPTGTPGKRRTRRGRRGKKKKVAIAVPEDGEDNESDRQPNGSIELKPAVSTPSIILPPPPPPPPSALVVSETVLGFGSHGTVVFEGSFQGRSVAVKRLLQDFVTLASREVSILQESDDHPNVIRYYYQETMGNFLYIALELCPASLADIIENPHQFNDIVISFDAKRALQQITSGLRHLHALKLVHRDIKPQNILISSAKGGGGRNGAGLRMLISDFGLCKRLEIDQTSFLPTVHGAMAAGTVGWRAPEILKGEVNLSDFPDDQSQSSRGSVASTSTATNVQPTRLTKSVDIFALGCLFYYTLTNGGHPYGDRFEREANIIKDAKCLDGLERFGEEGSEALELITKMLSFDAKSRPDTTTCLLHPFFWDPRRRLNFLQEASDRFEIMCREPLDPSLALLETNASLIVGNDWYARLDKVFIENLGKFRKYDPRSVRDLLRALRNKKHHYQDLPDNVKRHLGPMPAGFLAYFTRRFPALFLHVHHVVSETPLRTESMFRSYFDLPG